MWNVAFYVKADQQRMEYNYCVSRVLLPLFDIRAGLNTLAPRIAVQCKRRCAIHESIQESDDEGLSWLPTGNTYFRGSRRYRLGNYTDLQQVSQDPAAHIQVNDMAKPKPIADFVQYALQGRPPGSKTCLVLWGHGGGPFTPLVTPFTKSQQGCDPYDPDGDPGPQSFLSLPGLAKGLRDGLKGTGVDAFDVILFDACLMACVEAAYELSDLGEVMVASEDLTPFDQWDHAAWLQRLEAAPTMSATQLVPDLIAAYRVSATDGMTISAVRLGDAIRNLKTHIAAFVTASSGFSDTTWGQIRRARDEVAEYGYFDSSLDVITVDIIRLFDQLASKCRAAEVVALASAVRDDCRTNVVLDEDASPNRRGRYGSEGLAIFFPPTRSDYRRLELNARYQPGAEGAGSFVRDSGWFTFLERYWKKTGRN